MDTFIKGEIMNKFILNIMNDTDENRIIKRATFWNMLASLINSFLSSILLFIITRLSGATLAGVFSIASTVAYQCLSVGLFGTRNFHAADVSKEYSFTEYFYIRIISTIMMYGMLLYYVLFSNYDINKALIVLTFGLYKSVDCFEDLIHGEYHRQGRLDIAAILQSIRYIISLIAFVLVYVLTMNLLLTCFITFVLSLLLCVIENLSICFHFVKEKLIFRFDKIKKLFGILLPICISSFVHIYICNISKYAIDANLSSEIQTYFSILIMPSFVISLLSEVIFRPYITRLSKCWHDKDIHHFKKLIYNQLLVILILTIIVNIGGYVVGLRLLELIYNVSIMKYMNCLLVLLTAGGFSTAFTFLSLVLTILREQNKFLFIYIIFAVVGKLLSNILVIHYGIWGASILYLGVCVAIFMSFSTMLIAKIKSSNKTITNEGE